MPLPTIVDAMEAEEFFLDQFPNEDDWKNWKVFLKGTFGLPLNDIELATFTTFTGRTEAPTKQCKEAWMVVGRRGGKSRISAAIAVYLACFRTYDHLLAPGERATIMIMAEDKKQAGTIMNYIRGMFEATPLLGDMLEKKPNAGSVELTNRVSIQIQWASFRAVRGYTIVAAICDEIAFWFNDEKSANPDTEIMRALRPAMITVPGAMLIGLSSPYARKGVLYEQYRDHFKKNGSNVLVWQADTQSMHPSVDAEFIANEYEKDPESAASEYGAGFRTDLEAYVTQEAIDAVVAEGRASLEPVKGIKYVAFVDPSGGSQDSFTLAIAHWDEEKGKCILDLSIEQKPPFSPEDTVKSHCEVVKLYDIKRVTGDAYAGEWPREQYRKWGITYFVSDHDRSTLYRYTLPLINSRRVELLDLKRLTAQYVALERRVGRSGKDSISHPPKGHDDVCNAAAGAILLCAPKRLMLQGYGESEAKAEEDRKAIEAEKATKVPWASPAGEEPVPWVCPACGTQFMVVNESEKKCIRCNPGWNWNQMRQYSR